MKQFLLFACLSIFTLGLNAQVFVDADATGAGDGTSWADAYTDLNVALLNAASGAEVWITGGTYVTPDSVSFSIINKDLTVLGGFAGDEMMASAANPAANETILSGDVMGNDVTGTYDSLGYMDNNRVLFVTDTNEVSTYTVTLDGLTIANGGIAIDDPNDGVTSIVPFSGAGILTFAKLELNRVTFRDNRSSRGSAIAMYNAAANGSVFDSISLVGNFSGISRQIYINRANDVTIMNSTFRENPDVTQQSGFIQLIVADGFSLENSTFEDMNSAFSGGGVRLDGCENATITDCRFERLSSSVGGAIISIDCDDIMIASSTFNENISGGGGAIYHTQDFDFLPREGTLDQDDFIIDNCIITNNVTPEQNRGGGVTAWNTNIQIKDSEVSNNTADGLGGGLYQLAFDDRAYDMVLTGTTFDGNADADGAGGAVCLLVLAPVAGDPILARLNGDVDNCVFSNNISNNSGAGGALYLQTNVSFSFKDTEFTENFASTGGAIYMSTATDLSVSNSTFTENGSSTTNSIDCIRGGAVTVFFQEDAKGMFIDSTTFSENLATEAANTIFDGGGGICTFGGSFNEIPLTISNSMFMGNAANAASSGGALEYFGGFNVDIDNTEFVDNAAGDQGGAIYSWIGIASRDTVDGVITTNWDPHTGTISNSKFINSSTDGQGAAISTSRSGFSLFNNAFVNNTVALDGVSGGALIFNGNSPGLNDDGTKVEIGSINIDVDFVNNTFVDNFKGEADGAVGDHVALFMPGDTESGDSNSIRINLINNAFLLGGDATPIAAELGDEDANVGFVSVGNLFVESEGGNYFNQENGPNIPTFDAMTNDISEEADNYDEFFVDLFNDADMGVNLDLAILGDEGIDNPLINSGVTNALVPEFDLRGNPRGDFPDIGAYEADQGLVDTDQPLEESGLSLRFFPNPTPDFLNIENVDPTIEKFSVLISDQMGRALKAARFNGSVNSLDMSTLPNGVYNLRLYVNGKVYSKQIVKQ